jgi:hypothetical protein
LPRPGLAPGQAPCFIKYPLSNYSASGCSTCYLSLTASIGNSDPSLAKCGFAGSNPIADLAVIVCIAFDHRASADGVRKFKDCIAQCRFVETTMEVSGTYDLIVQGSCASFAESNDHLDAIRPAIAEFVTRVETNFISKKVDRNPAEEKWDAIWLPCEGGQKRISTRLIDKVEAEGDYMRVYVGAWNCLVHDTMRRLSGRLPQAQFIKLHRSSLVRIDFIDRLIHDDQGWTARLRDGSHVKVAKSHVREVLELITTESSTSHDDPTDKTQLFQFVKV